MKKLLSLGLIAVVAVFVFATANAQDEGAKKSDCASACKTTKVAEKGNCDKGTKAAKTAAADCCDLKTDAAVTRVAENITVTGEIIACKETMGKVAAANGMCAKGTPASGKSVLLRTADGDYVLISGTCKLNLPEGVKQVRARGTLTGSHLVAAALEVQDASGTWSSVNLEQAGI